MATNGIRGIRQSIPSGYMIGRQSPGSSKGAPGLIPLPPLNQQPIIAGAGGKATQGSGQGGGGSSSAAIVTVAGGTGINVSGAPAYTVSLQVPVTVADGGTNAITASGTSLDNITGFSSTGYLKRTGAGAYSFVADGTSHQVLHGGGTFSQVDLTADVTGVLPTANGGKYAAGQVPGTATNDNATAGNVGEYISSNVTAGSPLSISNVITVNLTSISLTAGDWDVGGNVTFNPSASIVFTAAGTNTTTGTFPDGSLFFVSGPNGQPAAGVSSIAPTRRYSLASTTTVYLVIEGGFPSGTCTACGLLWARRAR